jgi:phage virion morphogenesis protein
MAGAFLDIHVEGEKELLKALDRLLTSVKNPEPAFKNIGESLLLSHEERWDKQIDPDGNAWEPLSDKYKASKRKASSRNPNKILKLAGSLEDLNYRTSKDNLQLGTGAVYGATHQFGDDDRGIKARPFLGLSKSDGESILEILTEWVSK